LFFIAISVSKNNLPRQAACFLTGTMQRNKVVFCWFRSALWCGGFVTFRFSAASFAFSSAEMGKLGVVAAGTSDELAGWEGHDRRCGRIGWQSLAQGNCFAQPTRIKSAMICKTAIADCPLIVKILQLQKRLLNYP
jgi:hypothetical protein